MNRYRTADKELLHAIDLLTQMPILAFDDYDGMQQLIRLGRSSKADLPDLLIGLAGKSNGCETADFVQHY